MAAVTPTPTQKENDDWAKGKYAAHRPVSHAQDGSPIDPKSFDPTAHPPTTPDP
jgi:hypothetical protein